MNLLFSVLKKTIWITLCLATVAVAYVSYDVFSTSMPLYKSLLKAEDESIGKKYIYYLVDDKDSYNKSWWTWSYTQRFNHTQENKSDEFKDIKSEKELNIKCKEAYEREYDSLDIEGQYSQDIWRYCSVLNSKPLTISIAKEEQEKHYWNETSKEETLGKKHKDILVSTVSKDPSTLEFWKLKDIEFFGRSWEEGTGHHNKTPTQYKSIFEEWYDQKGKIGKSYVVKGLCGFAYEKLDNPTSTDRLLTPEDQVLKYCSI